MTHIEFYIKCDCYVYIYDGEANGVSRLQSKISKDILQPEVYLSKIKYQIDVTTHKTSLQEGKEKKKKVINIIH